MGNQAVSLRSFALFRSAVPVGRRQKKPPSSIPQSTRQHSVGHPPRRKAATTLPRPHLHTLSSYVRRGYYIHNTASFIPLHFAFRLRKLRRHTPFRFITSAVSCLSPLVFWRLLLRTAIGVGTASSACYRNSVFHNTFSLIRFSIPIFGLQSEALCPKSRNAPQKKRD